MEVLTKSAEETKVFGRDFANNLKGGETLALVGELGSGKTTFVQGLAEGLGIKQKIISPTFILLRQYPVSRFQFPVSSFCHVDLYRLEGDIEVELRKMGLFDMWGEPENIAVVEWADKARRLMPGNTTWIEFSWTSDSTRRIIVT